MTTSALCAWRHRRGADIYINHGGLQRGIEVYKGKAFLYGQPPLYLQNNEVTQLPSSMKLRLGLAMDSTAGELLEDREQNRNRAAAAGGQIHAFRGMGSAIHTAIFGDNAELKEIHIRPTEEYVINGRRQRLSVPGLAKPDSERFNAVLERTRERSEPFGTEVTVRDGMGVIHVA
jgi:hypothetical protein